MIQKDRDEIEELFKEAKAARERAHCPYSQFPVGAATRDIQSGEIFSSGNIENTAFGAGVCAERSAFSYARAQNPNAQFKNIVIVTDLKEACAPCGVCRQVMAEFCADDFQIHLADLDGVQKSYLLRELLPHAMRSFEKSNKF